MIPQLPLLHCNCSVANYLQSVAIMLVGTDINIELAHLPRMFYCRVLPLSIYV